MTYAKALKVLSLGVAVVGLVGCRSQPAVGRPCELGVPGGGQGSTIITVSALECEGRTCIQTGGGPALCAAACATDGDCEEIDSAGAGLCHHGFACTAVAGVGSHACQRFCICRDYLGTEASCAPG